MKTKKVNPEKLAQAMQGYINNRVKSLRPEPVNGFKKDVKHELERMITFVVEEIDPMGDCEE
jgi:hypothetical protein